MPSNNGLQTIALMDAIRLHVQAAIPSIPSGHIYFGKPRVVQPKLPYVVIDPGQVEVDLEGALSSYTDVTQVNSFLITGRFTLPSDPAYFVVYAQTDQMNAIIAEVQGEEFIYPAHTVPNANPEQPPVNVPAMAIGSLPVVTGCDFSDGAPENENEYSFAMTLNVLTSAPHH